MELNTVKTITTWNDAAESINSNTQKIGIELDKLKSATYKNKGYYKSYGDLIAACPTASLGSKAYVGTSYPFTVYWWTGTFWTTEGETGGDESVDLGNYYTKEETQEVIEDFHVFLSQEAYDALETKEDKLYFCYEE